MDTHTDSKLIDAMGGTAAVARLCNVKPPSVSEWRRAGIPSARRQYLELLHPEVFALGRAGKKVEGNSSSAHGRPSSRQAKPPKSPRAKGRQGEVAHG